RAALDLMLRVWPGSLDVRRFVDDTGNDAAAVIDVATGETIATCDNEDRDDHATPVEDARAIVALRNAAPAIAALADECERLADLFDRIDTAFDQLRPAMADPFVAFVCATMHAAKDPAAPAPALLSDVPMGGDA
ncbi:MAG: hypothetical protein IPP67_03735, partial [Rhodospirillaceae bacterium]|nr:hypothetical protein [Rhodospirillaceae bacterium]